MMKIVAEIDVNVARATLLIRCLEQLMLLSRVTFHNEQEVRISMLNGKFVFLIFTRGIEFI